MPHSLEREKFMRHAPLRRCNFQNTHPCPGERKGTNNTSFMLFTFVIYYKKEQKVGVCDAL